ncbi:DUF3885 domain-containing protein [Neobacillus notoginsengisoli]|uniref:DUF3885 domain-containing protein n=1 Tax=Neobacillus notoginsengisoli TaxID=1578198 RepID=A0A417Z0V8_9BACI|nr:DUF3885 domain-containing protein [Neobacillus notoginsengisoli]RHW43606.1 DUF3885 domain-containing protein [Neobacillus notoginsengisoli]
MSENFPNLILRPPLFYNWHIGIRFQLGIEWTRDYDYESNPYLNGVYKRAVSLFKSLHSQDEEIFIVVDVNDFGDGKPYKNRRRIISPYVYRRTVLYKMKHTEMPYIFPEDDEDGKYKTHRFTLECKVSEIKYIPLLKAICNQDLGIQPSVFHRIYLINIKRGTIFHVYDGRGCDLLAASPKSISDIYKIYNDWILDYDRAEIDKVFN